MENKDNIDKEVPFGGVSTTLEDLSSNYKPKKSIKNVLGSLEIPTDSESITPFDSEENESAAGGCNMKMLLRSLKSILGFSIKVDGPFILLRSVYAFKKEDIFKIEIQSNGKIKLISNQYLKKWGDFYKKYITQKKSLIQFFMAVTKELLNMHTSD